MSFSGVDLHFARRVVAIRRALGLSAQQLADRIEGLDRQAIAKIEIGKRRITLGEAVRISTALDVPLEVMLGEEPIVLTVTTR